MSDPRSDAPTPEAVRELVERLRTLAKGLRFAAGRGKVSADNANYSCGVSIREAELSAQAMEDAAGLLRPTTDVAVEHEDTPPQPTRVLDLLVRLTGEGKRAAALRILERHMVSKIDDGTRVVQSARSDAPTPEAVRERLQRDATWLRQHAEALDQRADAYTALSAIAADCEDAAGLLRPTPDWNPHEAFIAAYLCGHWDAMHGEKRVDDAWQVWSTTKAEGLAAGSPLAGERIHHEHEEHEDENPDTRGDREC